MLGTKEQDYTISIHVPAWGTTLALLQHWYVLTYFNPRSRVGNDFRRFYVRTRSTNFNPRSRVGNDMSCTIIIILCFNFNPRSRVGNDEIGFETVGLWKLFQSTFPRGERHALTGKTLPSLSISIHVPAWGTTGCYHTIYPWHYYFNPRSRVGNDQQCLSRKFLIFISIHVPAWGTTDVDMQEILREKISIHVPAWGTTLCDFN